MSAGTNALNWFEIGVLQIFAEQSPFYEIIFEHQ